MLASKMATKRVKIAKWASAMLALGFAICTSIACAQDIPFPGPVPIDSPPGCVEWNPTASPGPTYESTGEPCNENITCVGCVGTDDIADEAVTVFKLARGGITPTIGQCLTVGAGGIITLSACSTGAGTPGGLNTYVQFNNAGALGGDDRFRWDPATDILTISGAISGTELSNGTIYAGLRVGVGGSTAASSACISASSDRIYHDTDCDGVKDSGEEFIDKEPIIGDLLASSDTFVFGTGTAVPGQDILLTFNFTADDTDIAISTTQVAITNARLYLAEGLTLEGPDGDSPSVRFSTGGTASDLWNMYAEDPDGSAELKLEINEATDRNFLVQNTGAGVTNILADGSVYSGGRLVIGSTVLGSAACISNSSDHLYHDTDCDGVKDSGEEFLDTVTSTLGTATWGSGSDIVWTFDVTGGNPTIAFGDGDIVINPGTGADDIIINSGFLATIAVGNSFSVENNDGSSGFSFNESTLIFQGFGATVIKANDIVCASCVTGTDTDSTIAKVTGATFTGGINLNDSSGDSPAVSFIAQTGPSFSIYNYEAGDDLFVSANSALDVQFALFNSGGGKFGLSVEGIIEAEGLELSGSDADLPQVNYIYSQVSLTADNQTVTPTGSSFLELTSNAPLSSDRTFVLANGTTIGQFLILYLVSNGNMAELADSGTADLSAIWSPTANDTITLIWNGTDWLEVGRSVN